MSLGNGYWYYNYDIQTETITDEEGERTVYTCISVKTHGKPTYEVCVRKVIRQYVSEDDEFDIINSYQSYLLGNEVSSEDYESYLSLVNQIKSNIRKDFNITKSVATSDTPTYASMCKLMSMVINTFDLTDEQAAEVATLYPSLASLVGQEVTAGTRVYYNGTLYTANQDTLIESEVLDLGTFQEATKIESGGTAEMIPLD